MNEYKLSMTASDVEKALGNALAMNCFELEYYIEPGLTEDYIHFTNMEQIQKAFDNYMCVTILGTTTSSGSDFLHEYKLRSGSDVMYVNVISGIPTYTSHCTNIHDAYASLDIECDSEDFEKGVLRVVKAGACLNKHTLVKIYAAPF